MACLRSVAKLSPGDQSVKAGETPMRMLIAGAGGIGGYYGVRLDKAGRDVAFLVRPKRVDKLSTEGLQIISPNGDVKIIPQLVTADGLNGHYDAILLAVKAYSLDAVLADMAPAV